MSKEVYTVVKQHDKGYYTIFKFDSEQYCDEDGNPIRYDNYDDAKFECDMLNDEFEHTFNKLQDQLEN